MMHVQTKKTLDLLEESNKIVYDAGIYHGVVVVVEYSKQFGEYVFVLVRAAVRHRHPFFCHQLLYQLNFHDRFSFLHVL